MFISSVDEIFLRLGVEVKSIGSYDEVFFPFWGVANYSYRGFVVSLFFGSALL